MEAILLRALHVLAAAILVGVPAAMALGAGGSRRAEWLFWSAAAFLVLGGVANLGALFAVPPPASRWGMILTAKLLVLIALTTVSAARLGRSATGEPAKRLWAASGVLAAAGIVLAVVLSHG